MNFTLAMASSSEAASKRESSARQMQAARHTRVKSRLESSQTIILQHVK